MFSVTQQYLNKHELLCVNNYIVWMLQKQCNLHYMLHTFPTALKRNNRVSFTEKRWGEGPENKASQRHIHVRKWQKRPQTQSVSLVKRVVCFSDRKWDRYYSFCFIISLDNDEGRFTAAAAALRLCLHG